MRTQLPQARVGLDAHPGLLLQRYVSHPADSSERWTKAKRDILDAAASTQKCGLYEAALKRWQKSLPELTAATVLHTQGRLIVGLGSENVLETGIHLHHTYGMPVIPGSALKGLCAHYCHDVWGPTDDRFRRDGGVFHQLVFGTTDDGGCIIFHDAWLMPDSPQPLVLDVMTPHHPKWLDGSVPPTDFDTPTPVPFLSVAGQFHVAVSWHGPVSDEAKKWTELSLSLLRDALKDVGVGGKTTSGYGRLILPPPPPPPAPPKKRASGEKAKVRIIAPRPKGGFDVHDLEPGRNPGTLTVGTLPAGMDTNPGSVVDVQVHVEDERKPQYKWPQPPK